MMKTTDKPNLPMPDTFKDYREGYTDGMDYANKNAEIKAAVEKKKMAESIIDILSPIQMWEDTVYSERMRKLIEYLKKEAGWK